MRTKDDKKIAALHEATIKVVNETGFASSSVSKIAKEAGVSPATIYVYYKNKEELLVSTYVDIKRDMSIFVMQGFDDFLPIRDIIRMVWHRMFRYASDKQENIRYLDQFSNSPFSTLVNKNELEKYFQPISDVLQKGIELKIIKDINLEILAAFMYQPIIFLSNKNNCKYFEITEDNIETAFTLAWDAIKL